MRSKIVRIGNSQGVRLPKVMIEQAGLTDEIELRVEGSQIVIEAPRKARAGWAEAAQRAHAAGHDRLESTGRTQFDHAEWGMAVRQLARVPSRGDVFLVELDPTSVPRDLTG